MFSTTSAPVSRTLFAAAGALMFAGVCLTAAAGPAVAAPLETSQARTAAVQYADLNLSSKAGAKELQRRVTVAAREVCARTTRDVRALAEKAACEHHAVDAIQPQLAAIAANRIS